MPFSELRQQLVGTSPRESEQVRTFTIGYRKLKLGGYKMLSVSERIIKRLSELNADESAHLKSAVDQHFIAACTLPPLVGSKGVECKIAVTAPVSAGKSTLFNALC